MMVSPGGQDAPSDKRTQAKGKSILKTNRRFSRNEVPVYSPGEVPAYLRSLFSLSGPSTIRETPSSPQDPLTPPTTLQGPVTLPANPSQQLTFNLPTLLASSSQSVVPPPLIGSSRSRPLDPHSSSSESCTYIFSLIYTYIFIIKNINRAYNLLFSTVEPERAHVADSAPSSTRRRKLAPRRNAAPNANRDANNKFIVELSPRHEFVDAHFSSLLTAIFQQYPQAVAWQFKMFPKSMIEKFWQEFKKDIVWDPSVYSDVVVKKAFMRRARGRYSDLTSSLRSDKIMPDWCSPEIWEAWWRVWNSPEFKRSSARAKKQRAGKSGVAKGTHTAGSVSHYNTKKKAEKMFGKPLNPDQFFLLAHTKEQDGVTFVNERCRETQERYEDKLTQVQHGTNEVLGAVNEIEAFYEAAGGVNREGRIFGLGSAASQYYEAGYPGNSTSSATFGASSSDARTEINEIRTTLEFIQQRLDGFNSDRTNFLENLQQVTQQQERHE